MFRKIKTRNKIIYSVLILFIFSMFRGSTEAEIEQEENTPIADSLMKPGFFEIIDQTRWNIVTIIDELIDINTSILDLIIEETKQEESFSDEITELKDLITKGRSKNSSLSLSTYTRESLSYIDEANNKLNSILNNLKTKLQENSETRRLMDIINIVLKMQNKLANKEFEKEKLSIYLQILRNKIVEEIIRRYLKVLFMKINIKEINAKMMDSNNQEKFEFIKITEENIGDKLEVLSSHVGISKMIADKMVVHRIINDEEIKEISKVSILDLLCIKLYDLIKDLIKDLISKDTEVDIYKNWPNPTIQEYQDLELTQSTENSSIKRTSLNLRRPAMQFHSIPIIEKALYPSIEVEEIIKPFISFYPPKAPKSAFNFF